MSSSRRQTGRVARVSAVDRVVEQIRDLIASQGLSVGDPLPTERELGERFGASRNTVREALRVVKAYGVIEVQPKTGAVLIDRSHEAIREVFAFQMQLSPTSFIDVQAFRRLIEIGLCEQLIQRGGAEDFDRLEALSARILRAGSTEEAVEHDYAFHLGLVSISGNRILTETYRMLRPVISHAMMIAYVNRQAFVEVDTAHREILGALRAQDRTAYSYLMSRHFDFGLRAFNALSKKTNGDEDLDTAFEI